MSAVTDLLSKSGASGVLCCDSNGLCLGVSGNFGNESCENSGRFTRLVRLASQLQGAKGGGESQAADGGESKQEGESPAGETEAGNKKTTSKKRSAGPIVTIETDRGKILVKEHDSLTVVMRMD